MFVSEHLAHFCYAIRLVHHHHLNSHVAYRGIPLENSNYTRGLYQHFSDYSDYSSQITLIRLLFSDYSDQRLTELGHQKEGFRPVVYYTFEHYDTEVSHFQGDTGQKSSFW